MVLIDISLSLPLAVAALIAAFTLAGCGDDSSSDTASPNSAPTEEDAETRPTEAPPSGEAARSEKVEISGFQYDPPTVTIQAGGKVTWLNQDSAEHTATLDDGSFTTGSLAEGKLKSESFKTPGTLTYHCEIHPQMEGTVEVVKPS